MIKQHFHIIIAVVLGLSVPLLLTPQKRSILINTDIPDAPDTLDVSDIPSKSEIFHMWDLNVCIDGIWYGLYESGWAEVTAMPKSQENQTSLYQGDIIIPQHINYEGRTYEVTHIEEYAFAHSNIRSLVLPPTIAFIGEHAFAKSNIRTIIIPDGVTSIKKGTFLKCDSLEFILLPQSVEAIASEAFKGCKSLSTIIIPNRVTHISDLAFNNCERLSNVFLPRSLNFISEEAFAGCGSLETICIPKKVSRLGDKVFADCHSLCTVVLPPIEHMGRDVFQNCNSLHQIGMYATDSISHPVSFAIGDFSMKRTFYISDSVTHIADESLEDMRHIYISQWRREKEWYIYTSLPQTAFKDAFEYGSYHKNHKNNHNWDRYYKKWYYSELKDGLEKITFIPKNQIKDTLPFSLYYLHSLQQQLIDWAEDKEGERTWEWEKRVTADSIRNVYSRFYKPLEQGYIRHHWKEKERQLSINQHKGFNYNDTYFLFVDDSFGEIKVYVPNDEAEYVDKNWQNGTFTATYCIHNDALCIDTLTLTMPNGKQYSSQK